MKNKKITLDADWLINNCLCWAMRYCMYRSSYASSDTLEMAQLINANRDKFNENKINIIIRDLRNCANERLEYLDNVELENRLDAPLVAYQLIAKELAENPDIRFCDYDWDVDCYTGEIKRTKREKPLLLNDDPDYPERLHDCDIDSVVKAIAILDKENRYIVKTKFNGKKAETICFKSFGTYMLDKGGVEEWKLKYVPVDRPHVWIDDECIIETSPISFDGILEENKGILKRMKD